MNAHVSLGEGDGLSPPGFGIHIPSLLFSTFAINILSLALPIMTLQVYDRILPNPGSGTLPVLVAGVCVAICLETALRLARSYVIGWSGAVYEHRMSCLAMDHMLGSDLSRLGHTGVGEYLHRMSAIGKLKDFHNGYALVTLSELAFVPLFLGVMIHIIGPLTLVPTTILMIFTLVSLSQGQTLRATLRARDKADDRRYNFLIESLEGIHSIKAFALENNFARRYEALEEDSGRANYDVAQATASAFNTGTIFSHIMIAAVIAAGAWFALEGAITTGGLIAAVLLSGRLMQPIQRALGLWARYQDYTLAREKAEKLFETRLYMPPAGDAAQAERHGTLLIEDVSFRHRDDGPWLLNRVNLSLRRGDCALLSADSHESRIALLELIAGMYAPSAGRIMVDQLETARYAPKDLIRHVGFLQTDGLIFRGTIRDNLTCFGQIPESEAQEMAAMLKLNRDIAQLPSGFDTMLSGTSQDTIAPGLKQRIAMARVLAPKPRVILFDSADRSLDREGYDLVYNLLARLKGKAAMILVSEDQNIRGLAGRSLSLKDGVLSEGAQRVSSGQIQSYRELRL